MEYPKVKIDYLTNKKGVISELVYQLKHQNKIMEFPLMTC